MLRGNGFAVAVLAIGLCGIGAAVVLVDRGTGIGATVRVGDRTWATGALPLPVHLDPSSGEALDLELPARSQVERVALDLEVTGDIDVVRTTARPLRFVVAPSIAPATDRAAGRDRPRRASFSLGATNAAQRVLIAARGADPVVISSIHLRRLRATHPLSGGPWTLAFLAVLVAASVPAVWLLHRSVAASQWTLVGVAVVGLVAVQPVFCGALVAILLGFFALGVHLRAGSGRRRALLLTGLLGAVGFLVAFKYGQDGLARVFRSFGVGSVQGLVEAWLAEGELRADDDRRALLSRAPDLPRPARRPL